MTRALLALAALASVIVATSSQGAGAANGSIRGRVELRRPLAGIERRPGVADLGAQAARDLTDRLRSVVYLDTAPRGAFDQNEGGRAIMDQRNETFVPHVLAITTGTTVELSLIHI